MNNNDHNSTVIPWIEHSLFNSGLQLLIELYIVIIHQTYQYLRTMKFSFKDNIYVCAL